MTKGKKPTHIHLYKRYNLTRNPLKKDYWVLKCQKPLCMHHLPLVDAVGKMAECNRCNNPFIMDKETANLARPHCQKCIVRKSQSELDALADILKDI